MIRGIIFDFDGTLFDSMFVWETAGEAYLRSVGAEPEKSLQSTLKTLSLHQSAVYIRERYGLLPSAEEIMDGINRTVEHDYFHVVQPKPGVTALLQQLQERGIKMCIATATDRYQAEAALRRCGIAQFFSEIFTCTEVGHGKDEPLIFRKAMEHLQTDRSSTLVIEDACHALLTAKRDGFLTAAIYDSFEPRQQELRELADVYLPDFSDPGALLSFLSAPCRSLSERRTTMKTALTIAGSDCSGGAGIQADLKTMITNGVYAMSAITALTAQNTTGVTSISEVTPEFLEQQLRMVFTDIHPDAVKIGMVPNSALIETVARALRTYRANNVVIDPVMIATSGSTLMRAEAVRVLKEQLLPLATLTTPNIPEAEVLTGMTIQTADDMTEAARLISERYGCAVLLKGGHRVNDANDLLCRNGNITWFYGERIANPNTHGTGCTLSSAIASNLAKGFDLETSVRRAKDYLNGALSDMLDLGQGKGPMNHAFALSGEFAKEKE